MLALPCASLLVLLCPTLPPAVLQFTHSAQLCFHTRLHFLLLDHLPRRGRRGDDVVRQRAAIAVAEWGGQVLTRAWPASPSKHILNAQVSIRAPCCRQFFDCPQCHLEKAGDHQLMRSTEMTFICKKCKKAFRKELEQFEDEDEYCPHCDNHYVRSGMVSCDPTPAQTDMAYLTVPTPARSSTQKHQRQYWV